MTRDNNSTTGDAAQRLFERGLIRLEQTNGLTVEVTRGMAILTNEGQEAGKVAAVVVDSGSQQVTHLLLNRWRKVPEYQLVPVNLIEQINQETIRLGIGSQIVDSLPARRTS
jgi:sporulation protein YlmC with PRC-barrel domain